MTDRPILFSGPMVRALLEGRKTQTRRVLKPQPEGPQHRLVHVGEGFARFDDNRLGKYDIGTRFTPGDRLWVKETWRGSKVADELKPSQLAGPGLSRIWYEADRDNCDRHGKLRPSLFMPRWASRLTLMVTDVRVERLQDISEVDAIAEGAPRCGMDDEGRFYEGVPGATYRCGYAGLWDHINGSGAWDANPWVVAVTFTVEQRNIDQ
jgi:hypothetical protein